ncbi:hypothetical protein F3J37_22960 [Pantoea sp. Al-1710]|uniref:Uncharacterized protein n=1 Tax=Candidatus Pantoea communis TaxID=2608354 RepID=A0ABX0S0D0_9GAMM|nr:hypothetical protein [Pantoea communis]NIG21534.1 hypothetical protein [Pantoea communis]
MKYHHTNEQRNKEGDVHKEFPEAAPNVGNAYEEDDHPAKDNPEDHGEIPRTRDDSKDHKQDPYQDK